MSIYDYFGMFAEEELLQEEEELAALVEDFGVESAEVKAWAWERNVDLEFADGAITEFQCWLDDFHVAY